LWVLNKQSFCQKAVSLLPTPSCEPNIVSLLLSHAKKSEVYERTDGCLDRILATKWKIPKAVLLKREPV